MDEAREILWGSLRPLLNAFAEQIAAADPAVSYYVESTSNASFLLRGYASLRKAAAGEEIAVMVDAAFGNGVIFLSSDACMDDGELLAQGPAASVQLSGLSSASEAPLAQWLGSFKDFLSTIEATVRERVAAL